MPNGTERPAGAPATPAATVSARGPLPAPADASREARADRASAGGAARRPPRERQGRLRLVSPAGSSAASPFPEGPAWPAAPCPETPEAPPAAPGAEDVAGYVADMCRDLAALAKGADLGFLAFLLDVAREEAVVRHIEAGGRAADAARPE